MEVDAKNDIDMIKKNGDDKSLNLNNVTLDDSSSKMNPMKWTVCILIIISFVTTKNCRVFYKK